MGFRTVKRQIAKRNIGKALDDAKKSVEDQHKDQGNPTDWIPNNIWLYGHPLSYTSLGPKMEYGEYDIPAQSLPRPYLSGIFDCKSPLRAVIKCRQSELTVGSICENLFYAKNVPWTQISHIFPTDTLGDEVSKEKISPIINESPNIISEIKKAAVRQYEFINGSNYWITGALRKAGGRAGTRNYLLFDEVDDIPDSVFGIFRQMLSHSNPRCERYIGTGTIPGIGIDALVQKGSMCHWEIQCPKCGTRQFFKFPDNIINFFEVRDYDADNPEYRKKLDKVYIGCSHCKAYIDKSSVHYVSTSRWVAKTPVLHDEFASFYINGLMISWKTGKSIMKVFHELKNFIWQFYNEEIGTAHMMGTNQLAEGEILQRQGTYKMFESRLAKFERVCVGIDWGQDSSWVVVTARNVLTENPSKMCVIYIEEINDEVLKRHTYKTETLKHLWRADEIISKFQADRIVADGNGLGLDRCKWLAHKYGGRFFSSFFDTQEKQHAINKTKLTVPRWNESGHSVTFSKTVEVQSVMSDFRDGRVLIPLQSGEDAPMVRLFARHLQNLAIQPRFDIKTGTVYYVVAKLGEDHFFDAHMYAKVAFEKEKDSVGKRECVGVV